MNTMKMHIIFLIISSIIAMISSLCFAENITVNASGEFVMGDNDTYIEGKKFAMQDAKRNALEKVGTYLESSTQVKNGLISTDEIRTYTAGIVKIKEIKEEKNLLENRATVIKVNVMASVDPDILTKQIKTLRNQKEIEYKAKKLSSENIKLQKEIDYLNEQLRMAVDEKKYGSLRMQREEALKKILENEKGLTILVSGEGLFYKILSDRDLKQEDETAIKYFIQELSAAYEIRAEKPEIKENNDGTATLIVKCHIFLSDSYSEWSSPKAKNTIKGLNRIAQTGLFIKEHEHFVSFTCLAFENRCSYASTYISKELRKLKLIAKIANFNRESSLCHHDAVNKYCGIKFRFNKISLDELKSISKIDFKIIYDNNVGY